MTDQPKQDAIVTQRDREVLEAIDDALGFLMDDERAILLDALATYRAEIEAATIERCEQLMHVIDRDRYIVAHGVNQIRAAIDGHSWLLEGRGPYEWDDDRYRDEFGDAVNRIEAAMEPLRRVAWDKSDCTRITERVIAAKEAASEMLKQPIGPREMIATDIMPAVCSECSRNLKGQTS